MTRQGAEWSSVSHASYHERCDWCDASPEAMIAEPGRVRLSPACARHGVEVSEVREGSVRWPILAVRLVALHDRDGFARWAPDGVLLPFALASSEPTWAECEAHVLRRIAESEALR